MSSKLDVWQNAWRSGRESEHEDDEEEVSRNLGGPALPALADRHLVGDGRPPVSGPSTACCFAQSWTDQISMKLVPDWSSLHVSGRALWLLRLLGRLRLLYKTALAD